MDIQVEGRREICQVNPVGQFLRAHVDGRKASKVADATLPRKSSKESFGYPYRKPTQVGEEKILRRE